MAFELNNYGFDETVERFNTFLESEEIWNSTYETSSAQAFVKMYGWVMDSLSYLVEETVRDLKFGTSVSMQAVLEHIKLVGYKAARRVSSECTVRFTTENVYPQNVVIPKGTRIEILGLYFITKEQGILLSGNTFVDVDVLQGYKMKVDFIGDGVKDQYYDLLVDYIDNDHSIVYVNGVPWAEVESFYGQGGTNICVLTTIYGGLRVEFGDSVFGNIPPSGSTIQAEVLISEGASGNINRSDVAGDVIDPIYAPDLSLVDFSVKTTTTSVGGGESEDVGDIKRNTPVFITSGGLYKRKSELSALFITFTEIAQVHVVTEADVEEAERDMRNANIINIYVVPTEGYTFDYATKLSLLSGLIEDEKLLMNTAYNLEEAVYLYLRQEITGSVPQTVSYSGKANVLESRLLVLYDSFIFGDDFLDHLLKRALTESLNADGITYSRDNDLDNLIVTTFILESSVSLGWYQTEGYILDILYDELLEHGIYSDSLLDDEAIYSDYSNTGILKKFPLESFKIEIGDVVETVDFKEASTSTSTSMTIMTASGIFSSSSVQGSIDLDTGEYELTVADDITDTVNFVYEYAGVDIPLEFNEYPLLHSRDIDVGPLVDL